MTNEQKFDLKNKFINRLGKRVFDICYGCISKINCSSNEYKDGFMLHITIVFYNKPDLHITFYVNYTYLLNDAFNYNLKHYVVRLLLEIYDTLYKELNE